MNLRNTSYLLLWVLLTTKHGRCNGIPDPAQAVGISDSQDNPGQTRRTQVTSLNVPGGYTELLTHYGRELTGINHGLWGEVNAYHGLMGHIAPPLHYDNALANIYGRGFHKDEHDSFLPLREARQISDGNKYNPPINFIINEHPERNKIGSSALYRLPVHRKLSIPLYQTNKLCEPEIGYSATGVNIKPTRQWHYPDVGDHAMGLHYGSGAAQQYSNGVSGMLSASHETAALGSYSSEGDPNRFHTVVVKEAKTVGVPLRGIAGYNGERKDHRAVVIPVMEIPINIPVVHGILPSDHENAMAGYDAAVSKGCQGTANMHNFGLHDMHMGVTDSYGASGYHMGGYKGKTSQVEHHGLNGYCGINNGYLEIGDHRSVTAKRQGSDEFGGSSQEPTLLQTGSQWGEKLEVDESNSVFNDKTYPTEEKQDTISYSGKDSSNLGTLMSSIDGKLYTSENFGIVQGDVNHKMEDNNEKSSLPEGINNKSNDMEEVLGKYTNSFDKMRSKTKPIINKNVGNNFLYETGMHMAAHPSVLSDSEWSDTSNARALHVDLLHGGTVTVDVDSDVQVDERPDLTDGKSGSLVKHITRGGSGNHVNSKVIQSQQNPPQEQGYFLGPISDKLAGGRLGYPGYHSNVNVDGKLLTGYNSYKYDNGVDFRYRLVPFLYQPWYYSYGQDYATPYRRSYRLWL